ncbi:MAG: hypothetical protein JXD21_01650 [Candidatus Omnitrophica bacterium]|nr:hypothetical protein [Candidatus Omnitrophota bacterium]
MLGCTGAQGWAQDNPDVGVVQEEGTAGPEAKEMPDSSDYVRKAWAAQGQGQWEKVYGLTDACIALFSGEADQLAGNLSGVPPKGEEDTYKVMNDVAVCYFIKGETLRNEGMILKNETEKGPVQEKFDAAVSILREVVEKYPYAQAFDPRGWYWSVKEKAQKVIQQIVEGGGCPIEENPLQKDVFITLYDEGAEFPVDYKKYGEFTGKGTKEYEYILKDPIGLGKAVGEGIYPNSTSLKFDSEFTKIKKELFKVDHWEVLNSRDMRMAFYKWNIAPEPEGVRLFYIASILERSGLIRHAIKAYYAVLVHFPHTYGWTYWHTPWYPGKVALYRIKSLLRDHPELGVRLDGASVEVVNGYDNNIRNDIFVVDPGQLRKLSLWEKICFRGIEKHPLHEVVEKRGGDFMSLVKYTNGDWQLLMNGKPFILKGITYDPTRVGESPDNGTLENWTTQDINNNGIIDAPYESWVDTNENNIRDETEPITGDFQLMKEMGVNCIRLYHHPRHPDKELLRKMNKEYGIYVTLGDFLGKYTIGSKAPWAEGTDYDNPEHKANMMESVKQMVNEFKDEPYVVMWLLGNENVYGLGCNADKKPESFFKFVNEVAKMVKTMDPYHRPVAIASGDILFLDLFAKFCPDVDVFGANIYRGKRGFLDFWDEVRRHPGIAAMVTEYGAPSYGEGYSHQEAQEYQAEYLGNAWKDIEYNSAGYGAGNAVGGFVFEWLDEWWKAYEPFCHDTARLSAGPFLSGYYREEWFGITGQGNGEHSPFLRQLKKAYFTYKKLWNAQ